MHVLITRVVASVDGRKYDLSVVPRLFLNSTFSLEDKKTFNDIICTGKLFDLQSLEKGEACNALKNEGDGREASERMQPTDKLLHEQVCLAAIRWRYCNMSHLVL